MDQGIKERLVNVFVYGNETHVHAVDWRVYEKAVAYDELTAFLRSRVDDDQRIAARKRSGGADPVARL